MSAGRLTHTAGVVVPLRSFALGKVRLAHALDDSARRELSRTMAERVEAQRDRYGFSAAPFGAGYLVLRDLTPLFARCGWRLEVHGWPGPLAEVAHDVVEIVRWGRRRARSPILIARRDG